MANHNRYIWNHKYCIRALYFTTNKTTITTISVRTAVFQPGLAGSPSFSAWTCHGTEPLGKVAQVIYGRDALIYGTDTLFVTQTTAV